MTPNKEDYLKCIYEISQQQEKVTNKLIASMMGVSAPAVSEMIKKLLQDTLIEKDTHLGYQLTKNGQLVVSNLIRKHRLIEVFLVNQLKYPLADVHNEAEILEHVVSDVFIDRLDKLLNYPKTCPHGSAIPRKNELFMDRIIVMNKVTVGKSYRIVRLHNQVELRDYLTKKNIHIGDILFIVERSDFAQSTTIQLNNEKIMLSDSITTKIFVEKLDE